MRFRHLLFLAAMLAPIAHLGAWPQASGNKFQIEQLKWMSGGWKNTRGSTVTEEHWTQPAAGTMIGMGRTIAGEKTVFYEYLRIESRRDGIFYVAHPKARAGTDFKMVRGDDHEIVFENPQHDFPKRIIYRRAPDGSMTARVEGNPGDKEKAEEFHYTRMN
jgi:hypothetical protein